MEALEATRSQRTIRATVLIGLGLAGLVLIPGDPRVALAHPGFWAVAVPAVAWTVWENVSLKRDEPRAYRGKLGARLAQAIVILGLYVGAYEAFRVADPLLPASPAWPFVGAAVIALGGFVRVSAIRTLDRHFSYELRVDEGQRLVTSGVYARVRHPSYLGLVLVCAGAGVAFGSAWGLTLGAGGMLLVMGLRIRGEERILAEAFGDEFEAYRRRSWRLLPFIY